MIVDRNNPPKEIELFVGFKLEGNYLSVRVDSTPNYMHDRTRVHRLRVPVPQELFEERIEEALQAKLGGEMRVELIVEDKDDLDQASE